MNSGKEGYGTAPPPEAAAKRLRRGVSRRASAMLVPIVQRFARDHFGGETVEDALCVARRLEADHVPNTLGLWPEGHETERDMADQYAGSIEALAASGLDGYLSIKPPALGFDTGLAGEIAARAQARGVGLHCDSHGVESADPSWRITESLLQHLAPDEVGTTLPGRWRRSLDDAERAIETGLRVRVVKGQWPDPDEPGRDMSQGCLDVVDRLAGRARHVAMASHDVPLLAEAMARLNAAGTACEVEVIFGAPMAPVMKWARDCDVPVRVYVPYGKGFIPNAISQLRRNPRLAWRVLRGMATRAQGRS